MVFLFVVRKMGTPQGLVIGIGTYFTFFGGGKVFEGLYPPHEYISLGRFVTYQMARLR